MLQENGNNHPWLAWLDDAGIIPKTRDSSVLAVPCCAWGGLECQDSLACRELRELSGLWFFCASLGFRSTSRLWVEGCLVYSRRSADPSHDTQMSDDLWWPVDPIIVINPNRVEVIQGTWSSSCSGTGDGRTSSRIKTWGFPWISHRSIDHNSCQESLQTCPKSSCSAMDHGLSELLCKWPMTCLWPTICSVIVACRLKLLSQSKNWKAHIPARMDLVAHEDTSDVVQFIAGVVIEVKLEGHTTWFFRGVTSWSQFGGTFFWTEIRVCLGIYPQIARFSPGFPPGFKPRDAGEPTTHRSVGALYAGDRHWIHPSWMTI